MFITFSQLSHSSRNELLVMIKSASQWWKTEEMVFIILWALVTLAQIRKRLLMHFLSFASHELLKCWNVISPTNVEWAERKKGNSRIRRRGSSKENKVKQSAFKLVREMHLECLFLSFCWMLHFVNSKRITIYLKWISNASVLCSGRVFWRTWCDCLLRSRVYAPISFCNIKHWNETLKQKLRVRIMNFLQNIRVALSIIKIRLWTGKFQTKVAGVFQL